MTELENEFTPPEGTTLDIDPIKSPGDIVAPEIPAEEPIVEAVEPIVEPEPEEPKKENKFRRFLRNLLRWTLGILIVFGVGFLTAIFAVYRPEVQNYQNGLNQTGKELEAAQEVLTESQTQYESRIAELEQQVETLNPLAVDNEDLLAIQDEYLLRIAILDARLDVANTQLALVGDDQARARVLLAKTGETLATIHNLMPENQRELVTAMEQRLDLVLTEIEDDPYAAQSDLDVLEKSLLELEDALFGG